MFPDASHSFTDGIESNTRMTDNATDEILGILQAVLPAENGPYALHEPELTAFEKSTVAAALDEGFVSYAGPRVMEFERSLAEICGVDHAIAMVNGTAALHIALVALGVGNGDEVLCPSLTFVGTPNSISHAGATPHFVDSGEDDLGIDPARLARYLERIAEKRADGTYNKNTGRRIAALVPVHVFGHIGQMNDLGDIAEQWGIQIVEDAAESLGSKDERNAAFTRSAAAITSFNGNKTVTTGGGGAVLTNDAALADKLRHLTTTAKQRHPWAFNHSEVAYNYRLPALNAALGQAQLSRLADMIGRKRALAQVYRDAFAAAKYWRFHGEPAHCVSNYWLNAVHLKTPTETSLDTVLQRLHDHGYHCRPFWTPMHKLDFYTDAPRDELPVAEALADRVICLPSSAFLGGPASS